MKFTKPIEDAAVKVIAEQVAEAQQESVAGLVAMLKERRDELHLSDDVFAAIEAYKTDLVNCRVKNKRKRQRNAYNEFMSTTMKALRKDPEHAGKSLTQLMSLAAQMYRDNKPADEGTKAPAPTPATSDQSN